MPFTVRVTVSPTWASPPTVPVIATLPPDSAILMMSSGVILESRVMVGAGGVMSTLYPSVSVPVVLGLPAASGLVVMLALMLGSPVKPGRTRIKSKSAGVIAWPC